MAARKFGRAAPARVSTPTASSITKPTALLPATGPDAGETSTSLGGGYSKYSTGSAKVWCAALLQLLGWKTAVAGPWKSNIGGTKEMDDITLIPAWALWLRLNPTNCLSDCV